MNQETSTVLVTDAMAIAFHNALTDGPIGSAEVEEIKTGLRAALASAAQPSDAAWETVLRERDDADDFIDALLDEVLGADRPEWSNLYDRADALNDVRERMEALEKPSIDRAWGRFEAAMDAAAAPKAAPVERPAGRVCSANCEYAVVQWCNQTSDKGGGDPKNAWSWPIPGDAVYLAQTTPKEAPSAQEDALDAARYRWLRNHGFKFADVDLGTDSDGENFVGYRIKFHLPEPANSMYEDDEWQAADIDAAIDAARAAKEGGAA